MALDPLSHFIILNRRGLILILYLKKIFIVFSFFKQSDVLLPLWSKFSNWEGLIRRTGQRSHCIQRRIKGCFPYCWHWQEEIVLGRLRQTNPGGLWLRRIKQESDHSYELGVNDKRSIPSRKNRTTHYHQLRWLMFYFLINSIMI